MQIPIITSKGERTIHVGASYQPDEGGLIIEHALSDDEGLTVSKTPLKLGPDEITNAFSEYIREKLEELYV